jgi:hypothetical protein
MDTTRCISSRIARRSLAGALTLVVGASVLAGASGTADEERYVGCVHRRSGNLRVIDPEAGSCRPAETQITWNEAGPAGPAGPPGEPGVLGSLDDLEGLGCRDGAGTVAVAYGANGHIDLTCVAPTPPGGVDCGDLVAFDPRSTPAYDDYPVVDETATNQYRSYLHRLIVPAVQAAAERVRAVAGASATGHGAPIGLADMSECDGSVPGTSTGAPGHPPGTHVGGLDLDVAYFQTGTPDNHLRPVCDSVEAGREAFHCVGPPDRLDAHRTAIFLEALASTGLVRVVGVDGRIGPVLLETLQQLCDAGLTGCTPVPLAFETTDEGRGWFRFHHDHMHIGFAAPAR